MLSQMDSRGFLSVAFRRMGAFFMVFIPVVAASLLYALMATPVYESSAQLLVKFGQDARPEVSTGSGGNALSADERRGLILSNVNILTSRDLAASLLDEAAVARAYPKLLANPPSAGTVQDAALKKFSDDLKTESEGISGIINVALDNTDPEVAASLLGRLIDLFIERQAEIFANPQTAVLRDQAEEASRKLEEANKKLYAYKTQSGIASINEELTILLKQRGDLAGYLSRRGSDDMAGEASALPMRSSAEGDTSRFPVIDNIQRNLDQLRAKEAELLQTYRANSDIVRNLRRSIAAQEAELNRSVQAINSQIADLDRQIAEKQHFQAEYDDRERQVTLAEEAYRSASERMAAAEINSDLNQRKITRVSVIQQPTVPFKAAYPRKSLILLLALVVGAALGGALVLALEILDTTFSRAEQLTGTLGRTVLASFQRLDRKHKPLAPASLSGLYRSIEEVTGGQSAKVIHLASCYPGEGTNTVAIELARYVAETMGRRVLCIGTKTVKGQPSRSTLLTVATGHTRPEETLIEVATKGQPFSYALLAEDNQADAVLASLGKLQQVVANLRGSFDLTIIAAAGVVGNPAANSLGRLADGTMFVVEAERTRAPVLRQTLEAMVASGTNILGLVLNKRRFYIPQWLYQRL